MHPITEKTSTTTSQEKPAISKQDQNDSPDRRTLLRALREFAYASHRRSLTQFAVTISLFCAFWVAMWFSLDVSYWLTLLLCIPTAFFVVRLFLIQHDCGHGAYFRSAWANNYLGRLIGILTATPYDYWRDTHATHHATTGHLENAAMVTSIP